MADLVAKKQQIDKNTLSNLQKRIVAEFNRRS
jgi:hypothetical protein